MTETPLTIKDETFLWLWLESDEPLITAGAVAQMLGIDLLELRQRHAAFLEREGSAVAARQRAVIATFPPEDQERMRERFAHLYEERQA